MYMYACMQRVMLFYYNAYNLASPGRWCAASRRPAPCILYIYNQYIIYIILYICLTRPRLLAGGAGGGALLRVDRRQYFILYKIFNYYMI